MTAVLVKAIMTATISNTNDTQSKSYTQNDDNGDTPNTNTATNDN